MIDAHFDSWSWIVLHSKSSRRHQHGRTGIEFAASIFWFVFHPKIANFVFLHQFHRVAL